MNINFTNSVDVILPRTFNPYVIYTPSSTTDLTWYRHPLLPVDTDEPTVSLKSRSFLFTSSPPVSTEYLPWKHRSGLPVDIDEPTIAKTPFRPGNYAVPTENLTWLRKKQSITDEEFEPNHRSTYGIFEEIPTENLQWLKKKSPSDVSDELIPPKHPSITIYGREELTWRHRPIYPDVPEPEIPPVHHWSPVMESHGAIPWWIHHPITSLNEPETIQSRRMNAGMMPGPQPGEQLPWDRRRYSIENVEETPTAHHWTPVLESRDGIPWFRHSTVPVPDVENVPNRPFPAFISSQRPVTDVAWIFRHPAIPDVVEMPGGAVGWKPWFSTYAPPGDQLPWYRHPASPIDYAVDVTVPRFSPILSTQQPSRDVPWLSRRSITSVDDEFVLNRQWKPIYPPPPSDISWLVHRPITSLDDEFRLPRRWFPAIQSGAEAIPYIRRVTIPQPELETVDRKQNTSWLFKPPAPDVSWLIRRAIPVEPEPEFVTPRRITAPFVPTVDTAAWLNRRRIVEPELEFRVTPQSGWLYSYMIPAGVDQLPWYHHPLIPLPEFDNVPPYVNKIGVFVPPPPPPPLGKIVIPVFLSRSGARGYTSTRD